MLGVQAAPSDRVNPTCLQSYFPPYTEKMPRACPKARRISDAAPTPWRSACLCCCPWLVLRWKVAGMVLAGLLIAGAGAAYVLLGGDSALYALMGMAAAMGLIVLLPRMGFRWLFGAIAGYIAAAPVLYAGLIRALDPVSQSLPASFRSRLWSWETRDRAQLGGAVHGAWHGRDAHLEGKLCHAPGLARPAAGLLDHLSHRARPPAQHGAADLGRDRHDRRRPRGAQPRRAGLPSAEAG